MRRFELWLDESGRFDETKDSTEMYSFVGGALVEKEKAVQIDLVSLLDNKEYNHAMNLFPNQKKKYVFPKLLEFKKLTNARYIYFENIEYTGTGDNRELYLQVMSEGLLQLIQLLEARYGAVELSIIIASRVAQKDGKDFVHIEESEYCRAFKNLLQANQARNEVTLIKDSQVHFHLERATTSYKLIIADFASNTRRIYQRPSFRDAKSRLIFDQIFSDVLTFSMSELSSDIKIRTLLSKNDVSEALMEVFLSPTISQEQDYLQLIVERMTHLNYRILKSQLKQVGSEILALAARQEDYAETIQILSKIEQELIPLLRDQQFPCETFEFEVLLQLSDAYLRSGCFLQARTCLDKALGLLKEVDATLENVMVLYRVMEKVAVFYIDSFQFEKAALLMEETRQLFEILMTDLSSSSLIGNYFGSLKSEYYGDVICMELYAKLFATMRVAKENEDLRALSDIGLQQYPSFEGELERHRQYRSRLEAQDNCPLLALNWLIKAILYHQDLSSPYSAERLKEFWDVVYRQETVMSQLFYLMYFSIVIISAAEQDLILAEKLYQQMMEHAIARLICPEKLNDEFYFVKPSKSPDYHPKEIIFWNLANYHVLRKELSVALRYYDQALMICDKEKSTFSVKLRSIVILAARASVEMRLGKSPTSYKKIFSKLASLRDKLNQVELVGEISLIDTLKLLESWEEELRTLSIKSLETADQLWRFSQKWRY